MVIRHIVAHVVLPLMPSIILNTANHAQNIKQHMIDSTKTRLLPIDQCTVTKSSGLKTTIVVHIKSKMQYIMHNGKDVTRILSGPNGIAAVPVRRLPVVIIPPRTSSARVQSRSGAAGGAVRIAKTGITLTTWFRCHAAVTMAQATS